MEIGKVPNDVLKRIILDRLSPVRSETIVGPGIGEDCCVVDFGSHFCVMSSDPITGTANQVGRLAVHVTCNDVAACGVEPIGIIATILAPPDTEEEGLSEVNRQLREAAASINVDILGGHTEITSAVTRFVVVCTAIGKAIKENVVFSKNAKPGDHIIMTKTAGLEGTAIIAYEKENELKACMDEETLTVAKSLMNNISVLKEGLSAADYGVSAMHDATEGGVLGAVWELCEASGTGVEIDKSKIPINKATVDICGYYGINPLKLVSSGCMIIAARDGEGLVKHLAKQGVEAAVIGCMTDKPEKLLFDLDVTAEIEQPESDELFKVCKKQ